MRIVFKSAVTRRTAKLSAECSTLSDKLQFVVFLPLCVFKAATN